MRNISLNKKIEKKTIAASGIIARKDDDERLEVLIIQRSRKDHWPFMWELPRGGCDKPIGEDPIHCVKREIKEETGLNVKVLGLVDKVEYSAEGGKRLTTCYVYLCRMVDEDQKVKLSIEHDDFRWINELGIAENLIPPEQKKSLEKVFNSSRSIVSYPNDNKSDTIKEYLDYLQGV
jgi:mutator protein MutT